MNYLITLRRTLPNFAVRYSMANQWKDRDKSAEKVYLNQQEKKTLEKLMNKLQGQQQNTSAKDSLFQSGLKEILKKHGISSVAFQAEVVNLHRSL